MTTKTEVVIATGANVGGVYFDTGHLKHGLEARTARGGVVTMGAALAKHVISLGVTVVIARLLLPSDYGLVAMVTAITGFVGVFKDLGLSMATVQREKITQEQISTLFWVNVGLSCLLTGLTAALAPAMVWFYNEPRLFPITLALASGFLIGGLAVQHQALLRRQMKFTTLAVLEVTSLLISSGISLGLALAGWGYWALISQTLTANLVVALGLWIACRWRPGWPARRSGVRTMLAFGGHLTGFSAVNYFARNLDNVLIGRFWGEEQLGLYAKAYQLLLLPIQMINAPIAAVTIPALSRLQAHPDEYRKFYLKMVSLIAFITMPAAAFMIGMSRDLIWLILGENWLGASGLFTLLGISAFFQPIYNTQGWVHISMGRTDRMLKWGLIGSALIVASFVIGLPFGAKGVALSYSCVIVLITFPCLWYAFQFTTITIKDLAVTIAWPLLASSLAVVIGVILVNSLNYTSPFSRLMIGFGAVAVVYGILYSVLPGGRVRLREFTLYLISFRQGD